MCATVFFVLMLSSSSAFADESIARPTTAEAKERFAKGNALYRTREFEKAIMEYKAGVLIEDIPVFAYNLAQCYRQLGRYEEAIWYYKNFLHRAGPTGEMRDAIEGFLKQMEEELAKKQKPEPRVEQAPVLKPAQPPPPVPKMVTVSERGAPWYADKMGWTFAGCGVIGAGVSLGLFMNARALDGDALDESRETERESLHDRAHDRRVIGAVVGGVGVAALAFGVVKLAMYPKDRERTVPAALHVNFTASGVVVGGRF